MLEQFKHIRTFVFDVDGVLTDGSLYVFDNGEQVRRMSIRDGYALQLAVKKEYRVIVISGSYSKAVIERLQKLGITEIHMRVTDKEQVLREIAATSNISLGNVLFMGDDIPDYKVMSIVGLPCSPCDAATEIKNVSAYISNRTGGAGCVRDVIEKVLKLNGDWELDTTVPSR